MGGSDSKERERSTPPQQGSYQTHRAYGAPQQPNSPSQAVGSANVGKKSKLERKYSRIGDNYSSLEQVTQALKEAGLESSNLIIGIDFTKSNEWTGKKSYDGRSLHHTEAGLNPYQQAITIIGKTLAAFDEDNLIPCYGFGDASTHDQDVFSFNPNDRFCNGFEEVLNRYNEIVPRLRLAGPTSFAPIIEMATTIVQKSSGQYHVLVIVADGQVTTSDQYHSKRGHLSPQEKKTIEALVNASKFPLSIILVGVGDGPWDMMKEFDDNIPARDFDNFQFVNFTEIMLKNRTSTRKETEFALAALMEIPSQYKATMELNLLSNCNGIPSQRVPLPPPGGPQSFSRARSFAEPFPSPTRTLDPFISFDYAHPSTPSSSSYNQWQVCQNCHRNPIGMAFNCGHQTCCDCGQRLQLCPICDKTIYTRIKLS